MASTTSLVTKYRWLADTPRAHITNQRAMEVLRDLGLEHEAMLYATPNHLMGDNVFCTSLAGEELGRMRTWGTHPLTQADHKIASPTTMVDLPQNYLEPILFKAALRARHAGAALDRVPLADAGRRRRHRDGARPGERTRTTTIRAKYLIGADGGNSQGRGRTSACRWRARWASAARSTSSSRPTSREYVAHRPSVLYWVLQPGSNVGGIGMGLVRMVRPWNEWLIVWGYDINQPAPEVTEEICRRASPAT